MRGTTESTPPIGDKVPPAIVVTRFTIVTVALRIAMHMDPLREFLMKPPNIAAAINLLKAVVRRTPHRWYDSSHLATRPQQ